MRITSNFSQSASALKLNVSSINNKVSSKETKKESDKSRDILRISPQGKKNSMIENLMKQRQQILDQKSELVASTLEKGGTMDSIKTQLEGYEEQLEQIDQQAAELMAKEAEEQVEKSANKADDKPETEEELQNKRMSNIVNMSGDMELAETLSSIKDRIDGEVRVKSMEISQDKATSVSPGAQTQGKFNELSELEVRSSKLAGQIAESFGDITDKMEEDSEQAGEENVSDKLAEAGPEAAIHGMTELLRKVESVEDSDGAKSQEQDT